MDDSASPSTDSRALLDEWMAIMQKLLEAGLEPGTDFIVTFVAASQQAVDEIMSWESDELD